MREKEGRRCTIYYMRKDRVYCERERDRNDMQECTVRNKELYGTERTRVYCETQRRKAVYYIYGTERTRVYCGTVR